MKDSTHSSEEPPFLSPWRRRFDGASQRISPHIASILRTYGLLLALVLLGLVFEFLTDGLFISSRNLPILLRQAAVVGIVSSGVALIIVMGHIDLSIGSAVGLCAIVVAWLMNEAEWSVPLAITATFGVGLGIGVWQGVAVTALRVPAFVVTLGGLLVFRGIGLVITEGNTISTFPRSFQVIGQGFVSFGHVVAISAAVVAAYAGYLIYSGFRAERRLQLSAVIRLLLLALGGVAFILFLASGAGFPVPVLIMGLVALILGFMASRTRFGRHLYAIGGNPAAAELSGIRLRPNVLGMFVIMGALYALAGVVLASRLNGAPPVGAPFLELDAIAAAVIGGTSLMGGVGTVGGALLGALLITSVSNGLSLMNVPTFYQLIATGLILILAVFLDVQTKRRSA